MFARAPKNRKKKNRLELNLKPCIDILVTKGFFYVPTYINSFYFDQPKNVNKNTALEIAMNTFCFLVSEDVLKAIVFIEV